MVQNIILTQQATIIAGFISVVATLLGTYIYKKIKKRCIPKEWKAVGEVKKMCIFPLKSGKRMEVNMAVCTRQGLMETEKFDKSLRLRDRSFVAYNETSHEYRNSRHYPKMVLIELKAHEMNSLVISAPGMKSLIFSLPDRINNEKIIIKWTMAYRKGEAIRYLFTAMTFCTSLVRIESAVYRQLNIHIRNEKILCIDCGNETANWISRYILQKHSGLRLAYSDGTYKRNEFEEVFKDHINFYKSGLSKESVGLTADLTALHIINLPSVIDVNKRMGNAEVTADDFRPNLLIDGPKLKPYEEDHWEWIKVGEVVMKNVMECVRCTVPTVDSKTGVRRKDREPLKTMEKYRMQSDGPFKGPVMGLHLEVVQTGIIYVGDPVYIGGLS